MRIGLVVIFMASTFVLVAQQRLKEFSRQQVFIDSVHEHNARALSTERNIPYQFTDSIGKRTFLLVTDERGGYSYRTTLNQEAARTVGAFQLQDETKGFRLSGEGMVCGIWEDGLVKDHIEFGNRILSKEGTSAQNHATHVTGTILAAGINAPAKGMAPKAKAYTYFFNNDLSEMSSLVSGDQNGLLFSNHSYGAVTGWSRPNGVWTWYGDTNISTEEDYRHGFYGNRTQSIDALAYLSPFYTIVWAAGNDRFETGDGSHPADCNKGTGYDCIIPEAVGKNIITVGAVNKVATYTSSASVAMSHFSSWGPTDDGRIKPDVVAAGMDVFSTMASGTNSYANSTGTSMATPTVTGSLMLLQELYSKLNAGRYMKAATLKALAIHTVKEAGPKPGPDYQFGWGLLDVKAAADLLVAVNGNETLLLEATLENGTAYEFEIQSQANKKIILTLSWTDPEGNPVAPSLDPLDKMLVNDLDIRLIDENGIITSPWVLNPSVPQAQAVQGDNTRDNIEKIEFETPLAKKYKVLVRHKGELKFDKQDFSLVLTYQSNAAPSKTFYWIGNSGQWQNPTNWALTSGGAPAGMLPQQNDAVIIDELSLGNNDVIELTSNVEVARMLWLNSRATILDLEGKTLRIGSQLVVSKNELQIIGSGMLSFSSEQGGAISLSNTDCSQSNMVFENGNWSVNGSFQVNKIVLSSDAHTWKNVSIKAQEIEVGVIEELDISQSKLRIGKRMKLPANDFVFNSINSSILVEGVEVSLDWQEKNYAGDLSILSGATAQVIGNGRINSLLVSGELAMLSSMEFDSVQMFAGAKWSLAANSTQTIHSYFTITSSESDPVEISSADISTISLQLHKKICLDNLVINNITLAGNSVVNAGLNSTIQNATNWRQIPCDEVLFADFSFTYPCAFGLTAFADTSQGNPSSWSWSFNGAVSEESTSTEQNPAINFNETGLVEIVLTVQKGEQESSFAKVINIIENPILENEAVLTSSGKLMSLVTAPSYQWLKDREIVEEEIQREFYFNNQPGLYEVLVTHASCNRLSKPYLVTSIEEMETDAHIFPNPANDVFMISINEADYSPIVHVFNNIGQEIGTSSTHQAVQTRNWVPGLYTVKLNKLTGEVVFKKVLIMH